jgi:hypothetical protein
MHPITTILARLLLMLNRHTPRGQTKQWANSLLQQREF